jgi:hypothetical protein
VEVSNLNNYPKMCVEAALALIPHTIHPEWYKKHE